MILDSTDVLPTEANTQAARRAARNWSANLAAIRTTQPRLADAIERLFPKEMEWVYARDGALMARHNDRWWNGCSLPLRSAEFMLNDALLTGPMICYLIPRHAAQVRVALDRMERPQAIIALNPDLSELCVLLACEDFSEQIAAHRLWFAWGDQWQEELSLLLRQNPGLPAPTQFVRPITADSSQADALVVPAQQVFAEQSAWRTSLANAARENSPASKSDGICVVAPSHFRLWDDAGLELRRALESDQSGQSISFHDPDDPLVASPAALALAAARCAAIVMTHHGRGDLPEIAPIDMPWVTWVTTPRIPRADKSGPRDALLLADPRWRTRAMEAGWKASQIDIAAWPGRQELTHCEREAACDRNSTALLTATKRTSADQQDADPKHQDSCAPVALIVDTHRIQTPGAIKEFSSHRLLWDSIHEELKADPFAMGDDASAYLDSRARHAQVSEDELDRNQFLCQLILPAWRQGIAFLLVKESVPLRLFGKGWNSIDGLQPLWAGEINSGAELMQAARSAVALIAPCPDLHAHPITALSRPILYPNCGRQQFLNKARRARSNAPSLTTRNVPAISTQKVISMLERKR